MEKWWALTVEPSVGLEFLELDCDEEIQEQAEEELMIETPRKELLGIYNDFEVAFEHLQNWADNLYPKIEYTVFCGKNYLSVLLPEYSLNIDLITGEKQ